jgi:hypothetical protein
MPCISPGTVKEVAAKRGSAAEIILRHCDDAGFLYLSVSFTPKNIGASLSVQGFIHVQGEKGMKPATGRVIFHDDGNVTAYGDTSNGVRFRQKRFDMNRPHSAIISCSFR